MCKRPTGAAEEDAKEVLGVIWSALHPVILSLREGEKRRVVPVYTCERKLMDEVSKEAATIGRVEATKGSDSSGINSTVLCVVIFKGRRRTNKEKYPWRRKLLGDVSKKFWGRLTALEMTKTSD